MAQQIKNNTFGFLNKDDEERFLPKGDYNDALNIRRQLSSQSGPSPIKNFYGNALVANADLASGDNLCIGQTVLEEVNSVFCFYWNSNNNHAIYQYNSITDTITKIVEDSYLNFQKTKFITGVNAIMNIDDEVLLYWTDDFNPPRKINVKRAILHNQGDFSAGYASNFSSGTDAQKAVYYDAVKHPPLNPITVTFSVDPSRSTNNIAGKTFQFRYRYIYDDGERSSYSAWSKLAISDKAKLNDSIDSNSYDSEYNNILIQYNTSDANNVDKIEFTYREGNTGDEKTFATRENNSNVLNIITFYNDSINNLVNTLDSKKLYDAVPLLAKSQEVKENVLYYANTVDGFDLPSINSNTKATPEYNPLVDPSIQTTIPVSLNSNVVLIDFSSVSVGVGYYYNVSFSIKGTSSNLSPDTFFRLFSASYVSQQGDSIDDVMTNLADLFNDTTINAGSFLITFNVTVDTVNDRILIQVNETSPSGGYNLSIQDSNNFFTTESLLATPTHKSGAYHPYGLVYYDRANRSSSVLKIGNPYVEFPTERDGTIAQRGSVGMTVAVDHTPPIWATHYQIVYAGNSTVDEYLQYTCADVYKGKDVSTSNNFDRIYLSLRNFQGTEESWKESTGALPEYNYVAGDRLRVISYYDPSQGSRVEPTTYLDFKVVGYEILSNSTADNPLITTADNATVKEQKSGYFLVLEDPKVNGFDVDTGSNKTTGFWYNTSNESAAYFEIYRPKSQVENFPYYEIGEKYSITNAGTASRIHDGGVRAQNTSATYVLSSATVNTVTTLDSATDLLVGDDVNITDSADNVLLSTSIKRIDINQTNVTFYISGSLETPSQANKIVLTSTSAVTKVVGGDSWFKPRTFFSSNGLSFNSVIAFVEDYYANDFISTSQSWNRGRPHAYSESARRVRRKATVWYSEPFYPQDDIYNGLSAFNLANTPYRDYDQSYGGIQIMKQNNEGIILWQEDKTSKILIDRNIIESAEGQATLTTNQDKLGIQVFYTGDYGIAQQPESLNGSDGVWDYLDIKRGKYLRLSNDGVTPVSDYKMRNYFYDKTKSYLKTYAQTRVKGGYDARNEESIITFPTLTVSSVATSSGDLLGDLANSQINDLTSTLDVEVEVNVGSPTQLTFGNEDRTWGNVEETWGTWGGNLYSTTEISETGTVEITSDESEQAQQSGSTSIPVYVNLNTTQGDFVSYSDLAIDSGVLSIPTDSSAYPTITATTTTAENSETLAFYEPANRWSSFYSFKPDLFSTINSLFISYKNGNLYKHEASPNLSYFYGSYYESRFTPIINDAPFDVKAFYALMIDGTTTMDIVADTNLNGTTMSGDNFTLKEGRYYGYLPFATVTSGDSAIIGLGNITVSGLNITVDGGSVGSSGIFVGDTLKSSGGGSTTITAISRNVITVSSATGFSNGNFAYVEKSNTIDGDRIRGNYLQLQCTITTADQTQLQEIYSVDAEASKSYY